MKRPIPTEREVLRAIYEMYVDLFADGNATEGKSFIPIDVPAVAKRLSCDTNLLFGYLYYYLEHKYRYKGSGDTIVSLFAMQIGGVCHAINFGYLAAILAGHDQEHSKYRWSLSISLIALALSVGAIVAQVVASA